MPLRMRHRLRVLCLLSVVSAACGSPSSGRPEEGANAPDASAAGPSGPETTNPGGGADAGLPAPAPGDTLPACVPAPACDGALPTITQRPFKKSKPLGDARHRGRDATFVTGQPQTLIGKFAYGTFDDDLKLEEVDIFVQQGCTGDWTKIGTATTSTDEAPHAPVDGIEDTGGRVYFDVPNLLPEGRHRIAMVVAGDGTSADFIVDVVPAGTRYIASDVDGTLTTSETDGFSGLFSDKVAEANPDAATVFTELAKKGFRIVYLTARPETEIAGTRRFTAERGFPRGLVHTSTSLIGALGADATKFKTTDLAALAARGASIPIVFGNTATDADAYENAQIPKNGRIFFKFTDSAHGGRRIDAYKDLLPEIATLAAVCK